MASLLEESNRHNGKITDKRATHHRIHAELLSYFGHARPKSSGHVVIRVTNAPVSLCALLVSTAVKSTTITRYTASRVLISILQPVAAMVKYTHAVVLYSVVLVESVQGNIADCGSTQVFDQLAALIDFKGT